MYGFSDQLLVKNTTREQREQIVQEALGSDSCAQCDCCSGGLGEKLYQDYIDGKCEISEITERFYQDYFRQG